MNVPSEWCETSPDAYEFDIICIGETMLSLSEPDSNGISLRWEAAGAESNVARYAAQYGLRAAWMSQLGNDVAGRLVAEAIEADGVATDSIIWLDGQRTGLMFKQPSNAEPRVHYYRTGSAASLMTTESLEGLRDTASRIVHMSGITMAISETCREMTEAVLQGFDRERTWVSFDINWRPQLWSTPDPERKLRDAANWADIVFVGLDEAQEVWGCLTPSDVRQMLPHPSVIFVKDGPTGAHAFVGSEHFYEPTLAGRIVDPIGAGDAFAAGALTGMISNPTNENEWLRLGHVTAMNAIGNSMDVGSLVGMPDQLLGLNDKDWQEATYQRPGETT